MIDSAQETEHLNLGQGNLFSEDKEIACLLGFIKTNKSETVGCTSRRRKQTDVDWT